MSCHWQNEGFDDHIQQPVGCQQPDAENNTVVSSFLWTKHRNVTDGRTDRIALAITAVCIASNADAL